MIQSINIVYYFNMLFEMCFIVIYWGSEKIIFITLVINCVQTILALLSNYSMNSVNENLYCFPLYKIKMTMSFPTKIYSFQSIPFSKWWYLILKKLGVFSSNIPPKVKVFLKIRPSKEWLSSPVGLMCDFITSKRSFFNSKFWILFFKSVTSDLIFKDLFVFWKGWDWRKN